MDCQVEKTKHLLYYLLFEFNHGVKAAEDDREICAVY